MVWFPNTFQGLFQTEFFSYALPWLLTFAIVYGILSHVGDEGMPKSNPARVIISLVFGFLVAPALSGYIGVLMKMTGSFIILIGGLLVFIVLLELLGVKVRGLHRPKEEGGEPEPAEVSIFEAHGKTFAIILGVLTILIFNASGGFDALGWKIPEILPSNAPLLFFFIVVVLMVWWMASE